MDYASFFTRFGASARTKNVLLPEGKRLAPAHKRPNLRPFTLPESSELPPEFIRLCPWEMEYLFAVARRARRGILEIGRFSGGSCFLMACAAADELPIYSIDLAPKNDQFLRDALAQHCPKSRVELIVGDSQTTKYPQIGEVDLLFIDGDHSYEGCMKDLVNWYGHLAQRGDLMVHDSYLGTLGVQDATIDFMKAHPELQVVQSPYIGALYWQYPAGSIAHFVKRPGRRRSSTAARKGKRTV